MCTEVLEVARHDMSQKAGEHNVMTEYALVRMSISQKLLLEVVQEPVVAVQEAWCTLAAHIEV